VRARGFTLIEVLVAMAVFSVIAGALYGSLYVSERAATGAADDLQRLHEMRTALDTLGRELEASLPEAEEGAPLRLRDRDIFGKPASQVAFQSYVSARPGTSLLSYRVEQREERLVLVKALAAAAGWEEAEEAEFVEEVDSFLIEAAGGGRWHRAWAEDTLPDALRITLAIPGRGGPFTLTRTVRPRVGGRV
jgi:general secretion pathway protein J